MGYVMKDAMNTSNPWKITLMKNVDFSANVKAVVSAVYNDAIIIPDMRLIEANDSRFVAIKRNKLDKPYLNKKTNEMVEYKADVFFNTSTPEGKAVRDSLTDLVLNAYDHTREVGTLYHEFSPSNTNFTSDVPKVEELPSIDISDIPEVPF